jgi:hypothetical protein
VLDNENLTNKSASDMVDVIVTIYDEQSVKTCVT